MFTLIEGLQELNVMVWNSNTLSADDFIGNGRYLVMGMSLYYFDQTEKKKPQIEIPVEIPTHLFLTPSPEVSGFFWVLLPGFNCTRFCLKVMMTLHGQFRINAAGNELL